jgi:hypothetical protein
MTRCGFGNPPQVRQQFYKCKNRNPSLTLKCARFAPFFRPKTSFPRGTKLQDIDPLWHPEKRAATLDFLAQLNTACNFLTGDETTDDFARLFDFGQTLESMRSKLLKEGCKEIKDHRQGIPKPFQFFLRSSESLHTNLRIKKYGFKQKKVQIKESILSDCEYYLTLDVRPL